MRLKRCRIQFTILFLVMGILVLGISAGSADETLNGSVTTTAMDPIATVTLVETPAPVPTSGTGIDANATLTDNSTANYTFVDTNASDVSSYIDLNVTSSQRGMQAAAAARVPAVSVNFAGGAQTILLVSSLDTQTAGYTNTEPQNPLEVTGYSYRTWSPSEGTAWSGSSPWYNAASDPFGSGARWISTKAATENNGDSWRLYKTDFTIPEGSTATSADLWYTADNAVAVYLNDEEISSAGTVYGTSSDTTPVYQNSYKVSFRPKPGPNTLKFVVRNWGAPFYNPTGLLYKGVIVLGPAPVSHTFSITNTISGDIGESDIMNELERIGWTNVIKPDTPVTKMQFGVNPGSQDVTLNDATLHWHFGHGGPKKRYDNLGNLIPNLGNGHTFLALPGSADVYPNNITEKWGGKNKWVILHSCYILSDLDWAKVLGTTHGIFGFATVTNYDQKNTPELYVKFLMYAEGGKTLYDSWYRATKEVYHNQKVGTTWVMNAEGTYWVLDNYAHQDNIIAATIFKDKTQRDTDRLPGSIGYTIANDNPADTYVRDSWDCHTGLPREPEP